MRPIPEIDRLDVAFGSIKHLPPMSEIPEEYQKFPGRTIYHKFVSDWFFKGVSKEKVAALKAKPGVDKVRALGAIGAILRSFQPSHEHKESGAAYLMSEWFEPPTD